MKGFGLLSISSGNPLRTVTDKAVFMENNQQLCDDCRRGRKISEEAILVVHGKTSEHRRWVFDIIPDFIKI